MRGVIGSQLAHFFLFLFLIEAEETTHHVNMKILKHGKEISIKRENSPHGSEDLTLICEMTMTSSHHSYNMLHLRATTTETMPMESQFGPVITEEFFPR